MPASRPYSPPTRRIPSRTQINPVDLSTSAFECLPLHQTLIQCQKIGPFPLILMGKKSEGLNRPPTGPRQRLDAVLLTHGHLDHTGRLPLITKRGYKVPVFATPATNETTALILRDSACIQQSDAERRNRKRERAGEPPQAPLHAPEDAEAVIERLKPVPYQQPVTVAPGIQAIWTEAGHMPGSAIIQLIVGYQAHGSLGRRLVEGQKLVSIHGEKIAVRAQVHTFGGFSAHAGQTDLLAWFGGLAPAKARVAVIHGEDDQRAALAKKIQQLYDLRFTLPKMGDVIEL